MVVLLVQIVQILLDGMNSFSERKRELFDLFPENSHQLKIAPETCLECPEHQCQDLFKYFSLKQNFSSVRLLPNSQIMKNTCLCKSCKVSGEITSLINN